MALKDSQIKEMIIKIESQTERKFLTSNQIMKLIKIADNYGMADTFNRLIFLAKFLHNTQKIMKNVGKSGEGYTKLSTEFGENTKLFMGDLNAFIERATNRNKVELREILNIESSSKFDQFLKLIEDLSWLKNYELDTNSKIFDELN
jgi:hypothetical protein